MAAISIAVRMTLTVAFADESQITVETTMQDQLRWEAAHQGEPWLGGGTPSFTKLLETAYLAGRRTKQVDEPHFDRWKLRVVDILRHTPEDDADADAEDEDEDTDGEPATFR